MAYLHENREAFISIFIETEKSVVKRQGTVLWRHISVAQNPPLSQIHIFIRYISQTGSLHSQNSILPSLYRTVQLAI